MPDRVPDPSELAEDLARIERAVERGSAETRQAIDALASRIESTYVRRDVYDADQRMIIGQVSKLDRSSTWAARTAVTAVVLPILVGIVVALFMSWGGPG